MTGKKRAGKYLAWSMIVLLMLSSVTMSFASVRTDSGQSAATVAEQQDEQSEEGQDNAPAQEDGSQSSAEEAEVTEEAAEGAADEADETVPAEPSVLNNDLLRAPAGPLRAAVHRNRSPGRSG